MKILIDIGHPAHVHYFKNFIKIMESKGHEFLIIARNKEITFQLLRSYSIKYKDRGKGSKGLLGKFLYLIKGDLVLIKEALKFRPDLLLSFGSSYAAHASFFLKKPHIAFDDTEHAKLEQALYVPFTKTILTPSDFKKNFGIKQIRFDSTMDIAYLHSKYFSPNSTIINDLKDKNSLNKIFLVRFVSWSASHDTGHEGFSLNGKRKLISLLEKHGTVLISSESILPNEFMKYSINISPENVHHLMFFCNLFVGESGSMATEAAILGTPSIIVNSSAKLFGVFERIEKYGSLFIFDNENQAINQVEKLLFSDSKDKALKISKNIVNDCINTTDFMVWFIENYPESAKIMKENPDYQYNFK